MQKITLEELRSKDSVSPAKSKKIKTNNGHMIRYILGDDIICFFVNEKMNHRVWILTQKQGMTPTKQEYHRLRTQHRLHESVLAPNETITFGRIANILKTDPYHGLTQNERRKLSLPSAPISLKGPALVICGNFKETTTNLGAVLKKAGIVK